MKKKNESNKPKVDKERQMSYDNLPPHIRQNLDDTEKELFLYAEEWPDTLFKKLEEFIMPKL